MMKPPPPTTKEMESQSSEEEEEWAQEDHASIATGSLTVKASNVKATGKKGIKTMAEEIDTTPSAASGRNKIDESTQLAARHCALVCYHVYGTPSVAAEFFSLCAYLESSKRPKEYATNEKIFEKMKGLLAIEDLSSLKKEISFFPFHLPKESWHSVKCVPSSGQFRKIWKLKKSQKKEGPKAQWEFLCDTTMKKLEGLEDTVRKGLSMCVWNLWGLQCRDQLYKMQKPAESVDSRNAREAERKVLQLLSAEAALDGLVLHKILENLRTSQGFVPNDIESGSNKVPTDESLTVSVDV